MSRTSFKRAQKIYAMGHSFFANGANTVAGTIEPAVDGGEPCCPAGRTISPSYSAGSPPSVTMAGGTVDGHQAAPSPGAAAPFCADPRHICEAERIGLIEQIMALVGRSAPNPPEVRRRLKALPTEELAAFLKRLVERFEAPI